MSFFSKVSDLFYDLFVTEPEEEEYIDSAGEDGKEAGPRMAGALPARAVRPLDAVIFVPRAYSDARRAVDAMEKGLVVLVVLGSNVDDETASRFVDYERCRLSRQGRSRTSERAGAFVRAIGGAY